MNSVTIGGPMDITGTAIAELSFTPSSRANWRQPVAPRTERIVHTECFVELPRPIRTEPDARPDDSVNDRVTTLWTGLARTPSGCGRVKHDLDAFLSTGDLVGSHGNPRSISVGESADPADQAGNSRSWRSCQTCWRLTSEIRAAVASCSCVTAPNPSSSRPAK